jgi:hypothetical protein
VGKIPVISAIRIPSAIHGEDRHDVGLFIDEVKDSKFSDAISPRLGAIAAEFFDLRADVGRPSKLRIDVLVQLVSDERGVFRGKLNELMAEFVGFEDSIIRQRRLSAA